MEVIFYCFDLGFGIDEVGVWLTLYQHLSAVSADLPALSVRSCKGSVVRVAIMRLENVGVSITGNSTNPTRFQHPVAGTYKKWCNENGVKYFSVASGGGTGRTLHPDNMAAGPASYGMTDSMTVAVAVAIEEASK